MANATYNRLETGLFTEISNRISYNQKSLEKYIDIPFSLKAFKEQMNIKKAHFTDEKRTLLVEELYNKYSTIETSEKVSSNIQKIANTSTFTVTAGHQLSLFTGPIYLIYKILHSIRLAEELKKEYPENDFVPIFWMASEDHDFEEIQSTNLFNQTFKWETDQEGPVGRFQTDSFQDLVAQFKELFKNNPESEVISLLDNYRGDTLGDATFRLLNNLFQSYGLVIVDGDNVKFKESFAPVLEKELISKFSFHAVNETLKDFEKDGIKNQVTPREINIFYIEDNFRARIQENQEGFFIEGKGTFTKEEILQKLKNNPENFSPNVILRPLFQESILPNLCYLGGGGEMAYWLELKKVFENVNCPYPLIQVRNSIILIDSTSGKKMEKLQISMADLFLDTEDLKKQYVLTHAAEELDFTTINHAFIHLKEALNEQSEKIDKNLNNAVQAETTKIEKQLINLQQKFIKAEKGKHEQDLNQIEKLKSKLFPNAGLQERSLNFFSLCSDGNYKNHIDLIYNSILPFDNDLIVIQ
jgi:bacillithiol biosynthesis cysteine-adding enzyme BshC